MYERSHVNVRVELTTPNLKRLRATFHTFSLFYLCTLILRAYAR